MNEDLYAACYGQIEAFALSLTRERAAAEDVAQETFLRAYAHYEELSELSPAQRRAWLYRTAKNLFIDLARKQKRMAALEEERGAEDDLSAFEVRALGARLPEGERELFRLRYFEGWNATELGERFGLPASTVRARLLSARKRLAAWI